MSQATNSPAKKAEKEKIHVTWKGWLALVLMLMLFSGVFKDASGNFSFMRVFDLNTYVGVFGTIAGTTDTFIGTGGTGAKNGFLFALTLAPGAAFCMGILNIFTQMGIMEAFQKAFTPLLKTVFGIPGACGLALVNSLNNSDITALLTKKLYDDGLITDDERSIFVSFQYPGSAPINNMVSTQAALLPISVLAMGPLILIVLFCKILGANLMRLYLFIRRKASNKNTKNMEVSSHE